MSDDRCWGEPLRIFYFNHLHHSQEIGYTIFSIGVFYKGFTPITDRIIHNYIRPLVQYAPTIEGSPIVPFYGFLLADLILIGLVIWDWRSNKRKDVFLIVLGIMMIFHISVFTFYRFGFWERFGSWFLGIG